MKNIIKLSSIIFGLFLIAGITIAAINISSDPIQLASGPPPPVNVALDVQIGDPDCEALERCELYVEAWTSDGQSPPTLTCHDRTLYVYETNMYYFNFTNSDPIVFTKIVDEDPNPCTCTPFTEDNDWDYTDVSVSLIIYPCQ